LSCFSTLIAHDKAHVKNAPCTSQQEIPSTQEWLTQPPMAMSRSYCDGGDDGPFRCCLIFFGAVLFPLVPPPLVERLQLSAAVLSGVRPPPHQLRAPNPALLGSTEKAECLSSPWAQWRRQKQRWRQQHSVAPRTAPLPCATRSLLRRWRKGRHCFQERRRRRRRRRQEATRPRETATKMSATPATRRHKGHSWPATIFPAHPLSQQGHSFVQRQQLQLPAPRVCLAPWPTHAFAPLSSSSCSRSSWVLLLLLLLLLTRPWRWPPQQSQLHFLPLSCCFRCCCRCCLWFSFLPQ